MIERLRNVRGSALLGAMAAVAVAGIAGVSAIAYNQSYLVQSHTNYVRAVMATLEANVRTMAMQPYAYTCDAGTVGADQVGASSCQVVQAFFDGVRRTAMPGARCPPAIPGCGIVLQGPTFAFAGGVGTLTAVLVYEGQEASIAPTAITMTVPNDVLQAQEIRCPPDKPVFGGVRADGTPNCKAFNDCTAGSYVSSIDFPHRTLGCTDLGPQSQKLNCSGFNDQPMINSIAWNSGIVSKTCDYVATPPAANTITTPVVTPPVTPQPGCPDTTYNDTQGMHTGYAQNSMTNMTVNFQSAVNQVSSGCKYSSVNIKFKRAGIWGAGCGWAAEYTNVVPGGGPQSVGFINGGGSGNKTQYGTVVVNGGSAYMTEASGGWGSAGGYSTAACISDVVVIVHSVPQ